jgi:hypothetical protein
MVQELGYKHTVIYAPSDDNPFFGDWKITMTPYFVHLDRDRVQAVGIGHAGAAAFNQLVRWIETSVRADVPAPTTT